MSHKEPKRLPKVTGLSPSFGPPGTKITVRGEWLGESANDIRELTVNGADCWPYLEWHSRSKIVTRCTKEACGRGDVIIRTNSGGIGTCDVQFYCHELEAVGPLDESPVWVDDIDYQTPEKETYKISSPTDEYSLSSARFKPHLYLLKNFADASLEDLKGVRSNLKTKLANRNDVETISSDPNKVALLKSNLPVIMECLQILERPSKMNATSMDTSIDSIARSIKESLNKTNDLFDPLLKQNTIVQSIESAMQVFKRNDDTFFDLQLAIENSIKSRNYDSIVKEISNVKSRLKIISINPSLRDKIERDVATKVDKLKLTIDLQLHESCRSTTSERNIDEVKKLISHLNRLSEPKTFDVWIAINEMYESLMGALEAQFTDCLRESLAESRELASDKNVIVERFSQTEKTPPVVKFFQAAIALFQSFYYDTLALGQSYFDPKDEFACHEDFRMERFARFNELMTSQPILNLCSLLRFSIISNLDDRIESYSSLWPDYEDQKDTYSDWLRHSLHKHWLRIIIHSVLTCYHQLTKANLPASALGALQEFKKFIAELRRQAIEILFRNAAISNKNLHNQEDWVTEVDDQYGSVTKLPSVFEANVVEILRFAKDVLLKKSQPDEESMLNNHAVSAQMKELAYSLINSFHVSLDNALSSSEEHPAESALVLLASKGSTRVPSQLSNRLLITICNYHFTRDRVFPRLKEEFKRQVELNVEKVFEECGKKYREYMDKTMRRFCAIKCKELTSECADYLANSTPATAAAATTTASTKSGGGGNNNSNGYASNNLQINLMIANSQIFLLAPHFVDDLMPEIINRTLLS